MDSMNASEGNESSGEVDTTPISVVHVSLQNHPIQVQQPVQAVPIHLHQDNVTTVGSDGDNGPGNDEDAETRKRREILARRPSYRKILNDLSSEPPPAHITIAKIEEESNASSDLDSQDGTMSGVTVSGVQYHTASDEYQKILIPAGALHVAAAGDGQQGLQTLTMTNSSSIPTTGATIVQYAQGPDGQFFIPAGNVQYQIAPSSLSQGVVMAAAGTTISSPQQVGEEASRKRELRLLKNREAARECRRKKKEYVKCLENRVAVLENQNKTLIEELKSLKELYCQKEAQS